MTFEEFLVENSYTDVRFINNGKEYIAIMPLIFTHAIVKGTVGNIYCYDDRWCYSDYWAAKEAIDAWDGVGEPNGWHRHPATGRRRPQGDELQQYVDP